QERPGLRNLVLAFQSRSAVQELLADALGAKTGIRAERRGLILEAMAETSLAKVPPAWLAALAQAMKDADGAIPLQAVPTVAVLQLTQLDDALAEVAANAKEPPEQRVEALRALAPRRPALAADAFALLIDQLGEEASPVGRLAAAEVLGRARLGDAQVHTLLPILRKETLIAPGVLMPALQRSVTAATAL